MKRILAVFILLAAFSQQGNAATVDVIFAMDASGSVGASGWELEKSFVTTLMDELQTRGSLEGNTYRFGVVVFATGASVHYSFSDSQTPGTPQNAVAGLNWTQGWTHTLDAVQTSLDLFSTDSTAGNLKHLMLLTDGNPYPTTQAPCGMAVNLINSGVTTSIIGVGAGLDPASVECLVTDPANDFILASSFNDTASIVPLALATVPSPVPVPASAWLFTSSLLALGAARRGRK